MVLSAKLWTNANLLLFLAPNRRMGPSFVQSSFLSFSMAPSAGARLLSSKRDPHDFRGPKTFFWGLGFGHDIFRLNGLLASLASYFHGLLPEKAGDLRERDTLATKLGDLAPCESDQPSPAASRAFWIHRENSLPSLWAISSAPKRLNSPHGRRHVRPRPPTRWTPP